MIWIIGAGNMGQEYSKVLSAMKEDFLVVGRGKKNTDSLKEMYHCNVVEGGLETYLSTGPKLPTSAIVAVNVEFLYPTTKMLIESGVNKILLEKPGGLNEEEISSLNELAKNSNCSIQIAYNRRFYTATEKAIQLINDDGGVKSFNFEFTEWSHVIGKLEKSKETFESWLLANSTHVIDLAFFLGGFPKKINCNSSGEGVVNWHPKASIFSGSGVSEKGALFSYQANWAAPGRWSVEVLTNKHKFIFRPMEELQIQKIGSVAMEKVEADYQIDQDFKPGLYNQTKNFINDKLDLFVDIQGQLDHLKYYSQILNGN